jgi:hypothetical protein
MATSWGVRSDLTRHSLIAVDVLLGLVQVVFCLASLPLVLLGGGHVAVFHVIVHCGFVLS